MCTRPCVFAVLRIINSKGSKLSTHTAGIFKVDVTDVFNMNAGLHFVTFSMQDNHNGITEGCPGVK